MTGSPVAVPRRIMHRWRQRMSGIELTILFSLTACTLLAVRGVKTVPASSFVAGGQVISLRDAAAFTLLHAILALFLAMVLSLFLAATVSRWPIVRGLFVPSLAVARAVPGLGLIGFLSVFCFPTLTISLVAASNLIWQLATALLDAEDTLPAALESVAIGLRMTGWQRFWRLRVPVAVPLCAFRTLHAMPGFWTRLLAAEGLAMLMGNMSHSAEGCGALVLNAALHHDVGHIVLGSVVAFLIVVLVDQGVMGPMDGWAQRYRLDDRTGDGYDARSGLRSWFLRAWRHSRFMMRFSGAVGAALAAVGTLRFGRVRQYFPEHTRAVRDGNGPLFPVLALIVLLAAMFFDGLIRRVLLDVLEGALTLSHVGLTLLLCCLLWVPVGVLLGRHNSKVTVRLRFVISICRLFPAILLYPLCRELGLASASILLFLGAHWLVAGVVLDGMRAIPTGLVQVATGLRLRGVLLWRRLLLPAIAPDLCAGLLMAVTPIWNAVMIAEAFVPSERGLGAFLLNDILVGDLAGQCLALMVITLLSLLFDLLILQPMAVNAAQKYTV